MNFLGIGVYFWDCDSYLFFLKGEWISDLKHRDALRFLKHSKDLHIIIQSTYIVCCFLALNYFIKQNKWINETVRETEKKELWSQMKSSSK